MASMQGREIGVCSRCKQKLLLDPETALCICCENDWLKEQLENRDLLIAQYRREKQELFTKLSQARAQSVR